jgi:hypothetical protein
MSRSVDLFIDADVSLEEMSEVLGRYLGGPLRPDGDARWVFDQGELRVLLSEHPYRDDGELLFSRYRFALSARVANDGRPQDSPEAGLLRSVAGQIQRGPAWPFLVVHDLQYRDGVAATAPTAAGSAGGTEEVIEGSGPGASSDLPASTPPSGGC